MSNYIYPPDEPKGLSRDNDWFSQDDTQAFLYYQFISCMMNASPNKRSLWISWKPYNETWGSTQGIHALQVHNTQYNHSQKVTRRCLCQVIYLQYIV